MSRTSNALKNSASGIISKIIALILGFASRTIFIYYLGTEYLGINGLYTEVLSVLSFAELGFGAAMTYAMYEPIAKNNDTQVIKLVQYYKLVYRVVALVVAIVGIVMLPFLPYVVNGADSISLFELRLYYCIFLFNTVVSYFVTFKYSVVNAHQKNYIITKIDMVINSVTVVMQIIALLLFQNFTIYLLTNSALLLLSRIFISLYLNKKFPILAKKSTEQLTREEKEPIIRNVKGLIVHQFSSIAIHSTDNIIISAFSGLGILAVGLVSNYSLLTSSVLAFVTIVFASVTSGFGNLVAQNDTEHYYSTFLQLNFINFWIYGFCCIAFYALIPAFITLWIGADKLIDTLSFLLIIINCYMQGQSLIYNNARVAKGDFNRDKWWGFLQALVNLVVSVACATEWGLVGVYVGTVTSRLVFVLCRPYSTYRFLFDKSVKEYYIKFWTYFISTLLAGAVTMLLVNLILETVTVIRFCLACGIVAIVPNIIFLLIYGRSTIFKAVLLRIMGMKEILNCNHKSI